MTYLTDIMADIIQDADIPDATARALLLAAICESAPTPAGYAPLVRQMRGEIERLEAHRDKARERVQKYRQLRAGTKENAGDTCALQGVTKALQGVTKALPPVTEACISTSTSTSTDTSTDINNNNTPQKSGACPGQEKELLTANKVNGELTKVNSASSSTSTSSQEGGCKGESDEPQSKPNKKGADIPGCLSSVPGFHEAFAAWVEFRAAKRAKATDRVKATILRRLAERPDQAVAALDTCMAAGWTDVKWDWIDNRNKAQPPKIPFADQKPINYLAPTRVWEFDCDREAREKREAEEAAAQKGVK